MSCACCGRDVQSGDSASGRTGTCPGCVSSEIEEHFARGITQETIMDYLIWSYGPVFVEELTSRLPRLRAKPRPP
ncbi:MAG TPA: hypothetical protein VFO16_03885 [Pseudonocardiaceae bacterium]|nr:hypothetical protein [Pseudonocardiaceae bacterium]